MKENVYKLYKRDIEKSEPKISKCSVGVRTQFKDIYLFQVSLIKN